MLTISKPFAVACACVVGLIGLAGSVHAADKLVIGAVQMDSQYEWYRTVEMGAKEKAKELDVELVLANSAGKIDKEDENVSNLIGRGVNAIVISVVDSKASIPAMQRAHEAGIPVTNYDSFVDSDVMDTFVGVDNTELGAMMGRYVVDYVNKNMDGKAKIALLTVVRYAQSVKRRDGFVAEIKKAPGIEIVAEQEGVVPEQASSNLETMLQAHPDIQLVWTANEGGTVGAQVAKNSTGADIKIFGTDMSLQTAASLRDPNSGIVAVATQDPYSIGVKSVELAVEAAKGNAKPGDYTIPLVLYTQDEGDKISGYLEKYKSLAGN
ncbi:MAG: substrate-binding domain-containing protein [Rhizobiaceae bacterium]|nr:substrate-binding domain-containing protein [Rhizobiaceae bacterium]